MTTSVRVPDRGGWQRSRHYCLEWLIQTWPGIRWDVRGSTEKPNPRYDVQIVGDLNHDIYEFQDPQKALLFKLAWG